MKRSRFTEQQIVGVLKQAEAGVPVKGPVQEDRDFGSNVLQLEGEIRGLERLGAEAPAGAGSRERAAEEDVCGSRAGERGDQGGFESKVVTPSERRKVARIMVREHRLSIARACRAAKLSRAAHYRQRIDWGKRDAPVIDALNTVVEKHRRWGFWKCFDRMHNQGHPWNHKRVHRVYCKLRLNLPRRTKKRLAQRLRQPLTVAVAVNAVWALDFMSDSLCSGRRFRVLNVLDEGVREALAIEIDTSLPAKRVVRVLDRLAELRGFAQSASHGQRAGAHRPGAARLV